MGIHLYVSLHMDCDYTCNSFKTLTYMIYTEKT